MSKIALRHFRISEPLTLALICAFGVSIGHILVNLIMSLFTDVSINYLHFALSFIRLSQVLLNAFPLIVMMTFFFSHQRALLTFKNIGKTFIVTVIAAVTMIFLLMGSSWLFFNNTSYEVFRQISTYFLMPMGLMADPVMIPLLVICIICGIPLDRQQDKILLSHNAILFLIFCAVASLFYWSIVLFADVSQEYMVNLYIVLSTLAGCLLYDRFKYAHSFQPQKFHFKYWIILVLLLILSAELSSFITNYIVSLYQGKYIANLIVTIFLNGLMMVFLTQLWVRKILYRM